MKVEVYIREIFETDEGFEISYSYYSTRMASGKFEDLIHNLRKMCGTNEVDCLVVVDGVDIVIGGELSDMELEKCKKNLRTVLI